MDDLKKVNNEIKKIKKRQWVMSYYEKHPDKQKEARDKWNKKNRKEYQRAYRAKKKPT